jgi:hypothetical protein
MTPDRWQLLQELFNAAVDLPPEQQAAFLNEACGDDENLRRQAESEWHWKQCAGPVYLADGRARSAAALGVFLRSRNGDLELSS